MRGTRFAFAPRMLENGIGLLLFVVVSAYAVLPARRRREQGAAVLPFVPAAPRCCVRWALPFMLVGPALMVAGLLVIVWPASPSSSDCHGSPVCGVEGLDPLGKLIGGGALIIIGVFVLLVVSIAVGVANARRSDTARGRKTRS
jgi:hypothetical protein